MTISIKNNTIESRDIDITKLKLEKKGLAEALSTTNESLTKCLITNKALSSMWADAEQDNAELVTESAEYQNELHSTIEKLKSQIKPTNCGNTLIDSDNIKLLRRANQDTN